MEVIDKNAVRQYLLGLQDAVCSALEQEDGRATFREDAWDRPEGGGRSRVLAEGAYIEKAGVNFSHVKGDKLPPSASAQRPELSRSRLRGDGRLHDCPPEQPLRANFACQCTLFIATREGEAPVWWFGGGFDLTPFYGFKEDAVYWHRTAAEPPVCLSAQTYTAGIKRGVTNTSFSSIGRSRAESVGSFLTISTRAVLRGASILCAAWAITIGKLMVQF